MEPNLIIQCFISLLLGAAIGLEREAYEHKVDKTESSGRGSLGVRSYSLVALLGALSTIIAPFNIGIFIVIAASFVSLLIGYYIFGSLVTKDHGFTTELAVLFTFLIGALIGTPEMPIQLPIVITVILTLILSTKSQIKTFVRSIQSHEINGFIGYAIIALVILPFLPNTPITLSSIPNLASILGAYDISIDRFASLEILNPFGVWRVVAIITGIEIAGYMMQKALGQKTGWLLTSFAGGFISSTSTTQSLANQSNKVKNADRLVASAVIANISSFLQLFILVASVSLPLLVAMSPFILALILSSTVVAVFFLSRKSKDSVDSLTDTKEVLQTTNIFSLAPALKFALIFMSVKIVTKILLLVFGEGGFLIGNILASVTGLDAVIFNVAELAGSGISIALATVTLASANAVNLVAKSIYSYTQGSKDFAKKFLIAVIVMIVGSSIGLIPLIF